MTSKSTIKISNLGLWTLDFGPWTLDFGLWTLDFGLWTLNFVPSAEGSRSILLRHAGCFPVIRRKKMKLGRTDLLKRPTVNPMKSLPLIPHDCLSSTSTGGSLAVQGLVPTMASNPPAGMEEVHRQAPRRAARLSPILAALFSLMAWMIGFQGLQAADPITYTFNPKNDSGDPAKGWYVHLPSGFVAGDVIIKDSGGKTLKNVRVIDRGMRTGVTVLFETDGAGVPDKGTDEIKLTVSKPISKTGTSGFRDKPGVKGIPIGDATFDPPWTDSKGGKGGTQPKEEKKKPQQAPPEEGDDDLVIGDGFVSVVSAGDPLDGFVSEVDDDEFGTIYPYSSEETNDELFGEWADSFGPDDASSDVEFLVPALGSEVELLVPAVSSEVERLVPGVEMELKVFANPALE